MNTQPTVKVGIMNEPSVEFVLNGNYKVNGSDCTGPQSVSCMGGQVSWNGMCCDELLFEPADYESCSFTLKDVTIGVSFHWKRKEDQTFKGSLKLIIEDDKVTAINILPIEDYLLSVISSEMSANASLELLKAHAVISRSWLLAQIQKDTVNELTQGFEQNQNPDEEIKWWDRDDHVNFDVCADDHCQRYQGITRQSNPQVVEAIEATRGLVLTYAGKVCDARFSKCCGGMTEVFESCWENIRHPYLVAKPDPYCNTRDTRILSQVLNNYDQETTDFYRWEVHYTSEELSELVKRKSGIDFGRVLDLVPMERGASGRIITLKVVGEKRTVTVGKELEIRKWLSESHLYSSAFEVEKTYDGFTLHGKGWGHGVGLCQIGAAVMGDQGFTYDEILSFYYPHAELTKEW